VAEDSRVPSLPRRAPDDNRHVPGGKPEWGSGLTQPLVLPESLRQRIRAALDYADDEAPPAEPDAPREAEAPAERPALASLPRRVPGTNNAPEPPARIARPAMLPSLVHPPPAEMVAPVPAATLGAIAAAAGAPLDLAAGPEPAAPQAAGPAEIATWPGPAIAVPAEPPLVPEQRSPADQQPDRRDRRDGVGNGARPPAPTRTPMTRVAMWAYLGQAEAPTEPLPAIPAARPGGATEKTRDQPDAAAQPVVPAQRAPAEQRPGQPAHPAGKTAGPEQEAVSPEMETAQPKQETASRDEVPSRQKNGQASLGRAQLHGTKGLARRPAEGQPGAPAPLPAAPPKASAPRPEPARPPERARRGRGFKVGVALALMLALAGSLAFLHKRPGDTVQAMAPTTGPSASAAPTTAAEVRDATAAWVASQVSRAKPISCDPVMCRALWLNGVPAADLLVLRPGGGDPLHSSVIVVTPAATKMVGTEFLAADAPAAIASFGSGSRQDSVRVIYPQGAVACAAALRQDIADRKANESTLLENPRVTAPPAARRQLQGGQIDSRLLLTLAQFASQWPLSIVAFGDRAPGASPGVPLRSADLAVTGDAAGRARQMSAFAHQLQSFYASARIQAVRLANGRDVVQVEFAAPSPLGVLSR
jgi:hypothetical protein